MVFDRKLSDTVDKRKLTSSMSLHHHEHPFSMNVNGVEFGVGYWPGDSKSGMVSTSRSTGQVADDSSVVTPIGEDLFGSL
jgi:hypothetical protein